MTTRTITLSAEHWQQISEALLDCCDEGPPGEGWKSPGLSSAVAALDVALAQPEPVGPTDEEIMELMPQQMHEDLAAAARALAERAGTDSRSAIGVMRIMLNRHAVDLTRAVLARWGRSAINT